MKQINAQYKVQPGKIENYTPGKSSISDKEAKQVNIWQRIQLPTTAMYITKGSIVHDN